MQAWRAVDRAYVDKTFNGQSWFKVRSSTFRAQCAPIERQEFPSASHMNVFLALRVP